MKKKVTDLAMIPPQHLSLHMRRWVQSICDRYEIQEQHFKILVCAAEAWDRLQEARAVITRKGICYLDRFGAPRARPEICVERDSRTAFVRCLRELALENEAPDEKPHLRAAPSTQRRKDQMQ